MTLGLTRRVKRLQVRATLCNFTFNFNLEREKVTSESDVV